MNGKQIHGGASLLKNFTSFVDAATGTIKNLVSLI